MKRFKRLDSRGIASHLLVPVLAVVAIGGIGAYVLGQSHATTAVGSWWTGHYTGNNSKKTVSCNIQGHYINTASSSGVLTRGDGFAVTLGGKSGVYMRGVDVNELPSKSGSSSVGKMFSVSYSGTTRTASKTGISSSYLPGVPAGKGAMLTVRVRLSDGTACSANTFIG